MPEALRVTIVLPRVSRFFTGSFVAHLLATIAVIWLPTLWRGPILPPDALAVELVGALPEIAPPAPAAGSTEPAEDNDVPPAPPDEATIATPPPSAPPAPTPKPKPKPSATPKPASATPRPSAPPAPAPTSGPASGTGSPEAATVGSAAAGGSVSALEGLDSAFGWYRSAVTQALYARWQRPIVDGLTAPVEVRVAFSIQRDGRVQSIQLEQSSGVPSLDRSALRAVTDASPLPPLPAGIDGPFLAASFVFRLYPEGGG